MAKLKTFKRRTDLKLAKSQFRKYCFDVTLHSHTLTHTDTRMHNKEAQSSFNKDLAKTYLSDYIL